MKKRMTLRHSDGELAVLTPVDLEQQTPFYSVLSDAEDLIQALTGDRQSSAGLAVWAFLRKKLRAGIVGTFVVNVGSSDFMASTGKSGETWFRGISALESLFLCKRIRSGGVAINPCHVYRGRMSGLADARKAYELTSAKKSAKALVYKLVERKEGEPSEAQAVGIDEGSVLAESA